MIDWKETLAPKKCDACGSPVHITKLSFGEDVAGNPTLVLGWACARYNAGCKQETFEMRSMRDGGLHIHARGEALTVERIDPHPIEDRVAFRERMAVDLAEASMRDRLRKSPAGRALAGKKRAGAKRKR